jgi:hypothetical protein
MALGYKRVWIATHTSGKELVIREPQFGEFAHLFDNPSWHLDGPYVHVEALRHAVDTIDSVAEQQAMRDDSYLPARDMLAAHLGPGGS